MGSSFSYGLRVLAAGSTRFVVDSNKAQHNTSVRAPIFYDSNDTAYYVNPNGTSRLNAIDFGDSSPTLQQDGDYLRITVIMVMLVLGKVTLLSHTFTQTEANTTSTKVYK